MLNAQMVLMMAGGDKIHALKLVDDAIALSPRDGQTEEQATAERDRLLALRAEVEAAEDA